MLIGYRSSNHPQQLAKRGPDDLVDDRATHPDLFAALDARFHFTVDVAASPHNTKRARFYTDGGAADQVRAGSLFETPREPEETTALGYDGLAHSWAGETVWCNPPYSDIGPWVAKAWQEQPAARGIVLLLPANRTEQNWWQEEVEPFRDRVGSPLTVEFLKGRIRFLRPGQSVIGPNERPPFGCCLLVWAAAQQPAKAIDERAIRMAQETARLIGAVRRYVEAEEHPDDCQCLLCAALAKHDRRTTTNPREVTHA